VTFGNSNIRHLTAFIEFMDVDGNVVVPSGWNTFFTFGDDATKARIESETRKFLTLIEPPSVFGGVPVSGAKASVSFRFPVNATQARILVGGIGNGGPNYASVQEIGVALTSTFELGLPALLLAAAAGYHKEGPKIKNLFTASIIATIVRFFFGIVWSKGQSDTGTILKRAAIFLGDIIFKKGLQAIITFVVEEETESAAEDAIPFIGWALNAVAIATTAAQLAETTASILQSPKVMEEGLHVTHSVTVIIDHDPKDFEFPATATHFDVFLEFSSAQRVEQRVQLPGTTVSDPLSVTFDNVPLGGTVKVVTYFYSNTDWIAGRAEKAGIKNVNDAGSNKLTVQIVLQEQLVPLSGDTTYSHKERMVVQNGRYNWQAGDAPTATRAALNSQGAAGSLASLSQVSVNQTLGRISYSFQGYSGGAGACGGSGAGSLGYAYRTVGLTEHPEVGMKFSGCYSGAPTILQNQIFTNPDGSGANLIIQPSSDGRYTVQFFNLDSAATYAPQGLLGIFPLRVDIVRLLPRNVVIGISRAYQKLFHLQLADSPLSLAEAPEATLLSGPAITAAGAANNPSLLLAPIGMDVGLQETLILLEVDPSASGSTGRLRAFDSSGNPIGYFGSSKNHAVSLRSHSQAITYLDMGIERKGYVYVLLYLGDGLSTTDYILEIYKPDGTYLTQTVGLPAGRFSLDAWRNVYSLNYESVTAPRGNTEPGFSQWIPSTPNGQELDS
jgi:hypothetical protein